MFKLMKSSLMASLPILGVAFSSASASAAIHTHCYTSPWGASIDLEPGTYPATAAFEGTFVLPTPPVSGIDYCSYEVSDITKLSVKIDYTGADLSLDLVEFKNGDGEWFATNLALPIAVPDNALFAPFSFAQHQTSILGLQGPLEQNLSGGGTFGIKLSTDRDVQIVSGTMGLSGTHYYLESKVPGPLPLFGAAAAFGYSRKLRNRIKKSGNSASNTFTL
jgi:hypothetical protein